MELPDILVSQVREGKAVVFLGAGASKESMDNRGIRPPDGNQLGNLIAEKFLGGAYRNSPLSAREIVKSLLVSQQIVAGTNE
jgi:hypothetical protein